MQYKFIFYMFNCVPIQWFIGISYIHFLGHLIRNYINNDNFFC